MSFASSVHSIPRTFESVFRCNHLEIGCIGSWVGSTSATVHPKRPRKKSVCWLTYVGLDSKEKFITGAIVMKNNSSECWASPCNFSDFKLTLEMAECVISPTLDSDLVDLLCSDCWKICIDQLGGYIPPVIIFGEGWFEGIDLLKNVDVWMNCCGNLPNVVVWMMAGG